MNNQMSDAKIRYNWYTSLVKDLDIMSIPQDFIVVGNIIKFNKPNKILEIGTGNAAWCIGINKILDNVNFIPNITAVENFKFVIRLIRPGTIGKYGTKWPKSKKLLEQKIEQDCKNLNCKHNIKVLEMDAMSIPKKLEHEKFDLIRLDCLDKVEDIEFILRWVHSSLTDDGLLCIDDITPSIAIGRWLVAMDLVREKLFKIVWIGDKEAIFSKWNSNKEFITNSVKDNINTIIKVRRPDLVLMREWCEFHNRADPGQPYYWAFRRSYSG